MRAWQPEDPVDREEWERRAAAQAREFYSRRRPAPPPGPAAGKPPAEISPGQKGTPSPAEMTGMSPKTTPGDPRDEIPLEGRGKTPAEARRGSCGRTGETKPAERAREKPAGGRSRIPAPGRAPRRPPLAPDQLLLLSLLFLLSQERADPRLLLAVAYILLAGEGGEERG